MKEETDKKEKLIELYLDGCITKEEYTDRKAKCDTVISKINDKINSVESGDKIQKNQAEMISDIEKMIDDILNGTQYDDHFYREILDKMVIVNKENIDVYLKLIPDKWSFVLSSAAENVDNDGNTDVDRKEESENNCCAGESSDKYDGSITETRKPISVNNPIPILSGMVNL